MAFDNVKQTRTGEFAQAVVGGTRIARMTQWSLTENSAETAWGDSDNGGWTVRRRARKDATGTIEGRFDTGQKPYNGSIFIGH